MIATPVHHIGIGIAVAAAGLRFGNGVAYAVRIDPAGRCAVALFIYTPAAGE
jgi:hypothetical protein